MNTCPICNGHLIKRKVEYILLGEKLGLYPVEACQRCNEHYFSKEAASQIEQAAKSKGLWDLKSITKVNKIGNALAIRLNKKLADFLKLEKGEDVIIYPESKTKIIIVRNKL